MFQNEQLTSLQAMFLQYFHTEVKNLFNCSTCQKMTFIALNNVVESLYWRITFLAYKKTDKLIHSVLL